MTSDRDLERALVEWMQPGPDRLADRVVVEAMTAVRQSGPVDRRGPTPFGRRWSTFPAMATLAAVVLLTALAALVVISIPQGPATPSIEPAAPTSPVGSASPPAGAPDPSQLEGGWSTLDQAPGLPTGRWTLNLGDWALVSRPEVDGEPTPTYALWLRPIEINGDEIVIPAPIGATCAGQAALYRWSIDGEDVLTIERIDDPCPERSAALDGRSWTRDGNGPLRTARTYGFDLMRIPFDLRIPEGVSDLEATPEMLGSHVEIRESGTDRVIVFAAVTQLFEDPCDVEGSVRQVSGGIDEVVAALRAIPGVEATTPRVGTMNGRRSIRLELRVASDAAVDCTNEVLGYWLDLRAAGRDMPGSSRGGHWTPGGTVDQIDLVDVDGSVLAVAVQAGAAQASAWLLIAEEILGTLRIR